MCNLLIRINYIRERYNKHNIHNGFGHFAYIHVKSRARYDLNCCYAFHFDVFQKPIYIQNDCSDQCKSHIHVNIIHYTLNGWKLDVRRLHPLSTPSGWGLWGMPAAELQTCLPVNHPVDKDMLMSPSPVWLSADLKLLEVFVHIHNIFKGQ